MSQKRFENFPKALPSKQRASIFTVVKGEVVTQRAKPLTIVKILAMTAGRERPKEYLMNLKLRQICVHLIGGDTDSAAILSFRSLFLRGFLSINGTWLRDLLCLAMAGTSYAESIKS